MSTSSKFTQTNPSSEEDKNRRREEINLEYEASERHFYDEFEKTWFIVFKGKAVRGTHHRKKAINLSFKEWFDLFPNDCFSLMMKLMGNYKTKFDMLASDCEKNNVIIQRMLNSNSSRK